jgi:PTS system mannose-specific IIB component/fructoselysine and glucoselysine-specific PTS system IIB component
MDVYFHSAADAAPSLDKYRNDPRPGILLTGDIDTMTQLVDTAGIDTVNVGGVHFKSGRTQRLRYVFLSPDEEEKLRALARKNVKVTAQDVPGARPIPLDDLLAGVEP